VRIRERVAQLVRSLEGASEAEQLILDLTEIPLRARDLEHRIGIRADAIDRTRLRDIRHQFDLLATCAM
jgi:hypothetical protein